MLSIKFIKDNESFVRGCLSKKNTNDVDLNLLLKLNDSRREKISEAENLKNERNKVSRNIAQ